ncbi:MAG: ComF family protein [Candidatus Omnitrophica bacterium]|nr:ComF family protein [Candidatus Omnitrophota bacterium]
MDYLFGWTQEIKNYWTAFVRIIYPAFCLTCDSPLEIDERYLCALCHSRIPHLKEPLCQKCAAECPPFAPSNFRCSHCRSIKSHYHRGTALFPYRDEVKTILHAIKFEKKPWYLKIFKEAIAKAALPLPIAEYDLIVPVPADPKRKRERDFNPAYLIAETVAQSSPGSRIRAILKKVKSTPPQSDLDRVKRLVNLSGAFRLSWHTDVRNQKILLVDDIVTTSATINECAKCLKEAGASRVDFFALARTGSS